MNRLKKRLRSDQGRTPVIDSDTENFMLSAIEEKATYHGRRTEQTMFTHRRVKVRDLKNIANHNLASRGKTQIRSCTTAFNRARPHNLRSAQAKRHLGKGLFCTKQLPKTQTKMNENTHFQRAHKKNIMQMFFSIKTRTVKKYCGARSVDDKAYVRPGTGEGFRSTRNKRILTPAAEDKAKIASLRLA
jgi:hypothetical protein